MPRRCTIDIGSNSILLLIAEVENGKILSEMANESRITGLGRGIDKTKSFSDEAMQESLDALKEFSIIIRSYNIETKDVLVTATEASRIVLNSITFFDQVQSETGLKVQIINADAEAYYTAKGVSASVCNHSEFIIVDMGGASTEFTHVKTSPFQIVYSISLAVGSVRASDWLQSGIYEENMNGLYSQINYFQSLRLPYIGVAGTLTTLGCMSQGIPFDPIKIENFGLEVSTLNTLLKEIKDLDKDGILRSFPYIGKRASSIIGGLSALTSLANELRIEGFSLSTYGLRYGTLLEGQIAEEFCI